MRLRILAVMLAFVVVGCGKKKPEPIPTPTPSPTTNPSPPPAPPPPPPPAANPDAGAAAIRAELMGVLTEAVYFEYDQDALSAEAQSRLGRKAAIMLANPAVRIMIAGHADERGSDEYNLVLGTRRATVAKRYLEGRGIDGSRIEIVSYGEERPASQGGTEDAWAQNRRDNFDVVAGGDRLVRP